MTGIETHALRALADRLRGDGYSELQYVPFAGHSSDYSALHLAHLLDEEARLLAAVERREPILYAYSLNREHYARRLSRRQRLLGELFLYNRCLPNEVVQSELPEYRDHLRASEDAPESLCCPLRLVPVLDMLCVADPIDCTDDAHVFLHNDSVQMALYLQRLPALRGKRVADVGTGSGILAVTARKQGAAAVIAADINPRALQYAQATFCLNDCADIAVREGSIEDVVGDAELIVSNPPYMMGRSALALGGGGAQGLDTALRFARCALERRRHAIFILELPAAGEHDVFIDALKVTPSVKRVLRRRPGYALTVYEFAQT